MNRAVYERNLETLEKKYPVWAQHIRGTKRKKRNFDVIAEESLLGDTILKVRQKDRILYLNGKYAPSAVVDTWLQEQGKIENYATVVVIGLSNGMHVKRIMEQVPDTVNILVYEPSFEVFRRAMEEVDLSFLFQPDIPVGFIVEELNGYEMDLYLEQFVTYDNMAFLKIYTSGNYIELFEEPVGKTIKKLKKYVSDIETGWNTTVRYTDVKAENVFRNLHYLREGYSIRELWGMLPKGVPVIVVSAGPSLNKNIMDLKKAQGKACIIATDTAMKPLLNAGITPDFFVIVDGLKPADLFRHKDISKSAMVTMTAVSVEPMEIHKGKKFFYYSGSILEREILEQLSQREGTDCTLPDIPTGGSVANSAYSLGIQMGAETIILVGQDLAMTGNRTHADGTFQDKMDEIKVDSGEYFEVESVDGGKVLSRADFKLYLDWFEKYIKEWDQITVVDATEGGALIHGTKVMSLQNAIKKYCGKEFNVKWHISRRKKIFSEGNEEVLLNYFADSGHKLQEVKRKAREGLGYYEKLEKLAAKAQASDSEIRKILKKIKKINQYMERDYMAETVLDSLKGLEYTLRPLIYQMKDEKKQELADVAEHGKVMLYAMTIAAEEISNLANETVVAYADEKQSQPGKE